MTEIKEKTNEFIEEAETQFKEWFDYYNRLEGAIKDAGGDVEQGYHERITSLGQSLHDIEDRLNDLKSSDPDHWDERKYRFQQVSWTYAQSYATLVSDMKKDERKPAGWLEGFTDRSPAGSAGWLEGTGVRPTGSEGWVEGMAERSPETEGWKEGYIANEPA